MTDSITVRRSEVSDQQIRALFEEHGVVLIKDSALLSDLTRLREDIRAMVFARLDGLGLSPDPTADLDVLFNQLCARDRKLGGEVFDHVKELASFLRVVGSTVLCSLVQNVLGTGTLQVPHDLALFRIDRSGEQKFAFDWHQDYPYNLMSTPAISAWIPVTDVKEPMGCLRVIPGTHHEIQPVRVRIANPRIGEGLGPQLFDFPKLRPEELEPRAVALEVNAGDILLLHSLVLHRSGKNQSDKARWVLNVRYGAMLDERLTARGWAVASRRNPVLFSSIHPELCVDAGPT